MLIWNCYTSYRFMFSWSEGSSTNQGFERLVPRNVDLKG